MPAAGKRLLFGGIGLLATVVAIAGVWLPGVPTVFPLIVALWAFSRSSDRLHAWVGRIPILKQALREAQRFEREQSISLQVKVIAQLSAWISTLVVFVLTRHLLLTVGVAAAAIACSVFMATIPTRSERTARQGARSDITE